MNPNYGIAGQSAPEFRFDNWIANVDSDTGLSIAEIEQPYIYLYNFQSWCPGCHSSGFPTMAKVRDGLRAEGLDDQVKFIAVQTVFEGHDTNTEAKALESVARHGLDDIALGHDSGHPPTIMADYRTGGTPWTVIIGPKPERTVLFDGFHVNGDALLEAFTKSLNGQESILTKS